MDVSNAPQRVNEARTKVRRALQDLHALRCAAVAGHYDPVAFERAMKVYREADTELRQVPPAWAHIPQEAPPWPPAAVAVAAQELAATAHEPLESMPSLRFVKWLVETGRLSG